MKDRNLKLEKVIRENLKKHRKLLGLTQGQMADYVGLKRSSYTKKELGETAILIRDVEILAEKLQLGVSELLSGYPNIHFMDKFGCLTSKAMDVFPLSKNIVEQMNVAAETLEQHDIDFLIHTLSHAIAKITPDHIK